MSSSEKQRLAAQIESRWVDFQSALSDQRKYPVQPFSPSSSRHRSFQVFLTSQLGQVSSAQRAIFKTAM
jgi:hypothetical protein